MRRLISVLVVGLLATACGDNQDAPRDAAPVDDASVSDAPPGVVGPCLDRPTDLARPPSGALSCDLLPPGFVPPR